MFPVTRDIAAAEDVISLLRRHASELRAAGILHISLFGSVARRKARADSDIDLAVEFDRGARMDLFALAGLERRLVPAASLPRGAKPPMKSRRLSR
jgi:predicted nucleotidyltransferase